jgi:hypothetical protein
VAAGEAEEAVGGGDRQPMSKELIMKLIKLDRIARLSLLTLMAVALSCHLLAATPDTATSQQKSFATPDEAASALIAASENYDVPALLEILGPDGKDLVTSADPVQEKNQAAAFAALARQKHEVKVDPKNASRATLIVGNHDWPFPVPMVKNKGKWVFNSKQGSQEILFRRIGANELDAIQVCRGFVDAQQDYAFLARQFTGVTQYAQKIISTPGKHDGLYWQKPDGSPGGIISETIARAIAEGYTPGSGSGYHGYHFKVLKGQGAAAPMGEMDYVIEGVMIGGFALLAVPAEYRVTGVKTFMVGYDGVVYQKDLGPDTIKIAEKIDRYNPDSTWQRTNDQWPEDVWASASAPAQQ